MKVITDVKMLRAALAGANRADIGFVPTMGALHAGHRSLVERARRENPIVVVSVFVNPTQFNDKTDLKNYPRTPEADARLLAEAGADYVLMPSVEEIYPEPDTRQFDFGAIDKVMEGATRPGHFNGVAQVVSRLFAIVNPGRASAPRIYATLRGAVEQSQRLTPAELKAWVAGEVERNPLLKVIYYQSVDALTMQEVAAWSDSTHIQGCIAVQAGPIRLIDNIRIR